MPKITNPCYVLEIAHQKGQIAVILRLSRVIEHELNNNFGLKIIGEKISPKIKTHPSFNQPITACVCPAGKACHTAV